MERDASSALSLREAAAQLGVHYMTAYRYVRTGRLPGELVGGEWRIRAADVEALVERRGRPDPPRPMRGVDGERFVAPLESRLLAGDEPGAWALVEEALLAGLEPVAVHLELLAAAMRSIGDGWAAGRVSVDEEHRATAVCHRLVGRLGPRFARPGRTFGSVLLAGAPGDPHALPVAFASDVVRAAGFAVVDLGASVPPEAVAHAAAATDRLVAVGLCVSGVPAPDGVAALGAAVAAVRNVVPGVAVLLGGGGARAALAAQVGADWWDPGAAGLVEHLRSLRSPAAG